MSRLCFALLLCCSVTLAARSSSGGGGYGRGGGGNYGRGGGTGYGTQTHTYPQSTGYSGNRYSGQTHSYPSSTGLSGNRHTGYSRTEVHHHYHYNPPQQISYGSQHLPVYQHPPPVYVYEYRNSGSRFDTLLTGLALYNLGRMSAHHDRYDDRYRDYRSRSGETCKLGISKTNGEYEETRIDCKLMSSFIWDADNSKIDSSNGQKIITNSVTTVTNVTKLNLNTSDSDNSTRNDGVTVTVSNTTTVVDALQAKGPSIAVQPGMNCFMIRISVDSSIFKRKVDCGILQTYAVQSLHPNKAVCSNSMFILATVPLFMIYFR